MHPDKWLQLGLFQGTVRSGSRKQRSHCPNHFVSLGRQGDKTEFLFFFSYPPRITVHLQTTEMISQGEKGCFGAIWHYPVLSFPPPTFIFKSPVVSQPGAGKSTLPLPASGQRGPGNYSSVCFLPSFCSSTLLSSIVKECTSLPSNNNVTNF